MESHAQYTLVGTVVLVLVALTVFGALWLSRAGDSREYNYYTVYFKNHSLAGLQQDSAVTMRGIKVGTVKSFRIAPADIERVKVLLKVDAETPVKTDTEAIVQRNLLTGLAYIDLVRSTSGAPFLMARDGEDLPVIPEGRSQLDEITSDVPKMIQEMSGLVAQARAFLTPENQQAAADILANIRTVSEKFASSDSDLSGLAGSLTQLSGNLDTLVKHLDTRTGELTASIQQTSSALALQAQTIGRDIGRAAQGLAVTLDKYQDPKALIAGPAQGALGPGE